MAIPPRLSEQPCPKRQRLPSVDEDSDEDDEDFNADSLGDEDEDSDDSDDGSEEMEEEEQGEIAQTVGGTRMGTMGNDPVDVTRSVSSSPSSSSSQSVKLKNSEVLDCPICCEALKKPIYQCTNGHLSCSSCCKKVNKRCPFCRLPIGDIRCRAMEKVIEASTVPCLNANYGCKQSTVYGNQPSHEKLCVFARCFCPLLSCNYVGSYKDLQSHARAAHSQDEDNLIPFVFNQPLIFGMNLNRKKMAVFQEKKEGDLIVVQAFNGSSHGVYVTVSCIAPVAPEIRKLSCSLAKLEALSTLRLGLLVKKIQKVGELEQPQDAFMLIPSYMLNEGHLKLQICIGTGNKYVHI